MYMGQVHIQFVSVHDSQHGGWREAAPSKLSHAHTPPGRVMPYTAISDLYLTEHLQRSTHPAIPGSPALRRHSVPYCSLNHETAVPDMLYREVMVSVLHRSCNMLCTAWCKTKQTVMGRD